MKYSIIINGDTNDNAEISGVLSFPVVGKIIKAKDTTVLKVAKTLNKEILGVTKNDEG